MRSHFRIAACLVIALLASAASALAQTGEFAAHVPGTVVHYGYALQDWLQDLRNGKREPAPVPETVQTPVVLLPLLSEPAPVKPKKATKKTAASRQAQTKQSQ